MKQELIVIPKTLPVEVGLLPPRPVWDEHLDLYQERAKGFSCLSREDFDAAKALAQEGTLLKQQIKQSYDPLTQAIDAIKAPIVSRRDEDIAKVTNAVKVVDSVALSWKAEQDRIAREKAEAERQAEIKRREETRQAEIKRQEELRAQQVAVAAEWGDDEPIPEVIVPEIIPPRQVTADSGFAYRKGAKTKPKLIVTVVDPDKVERRYCSPDMVRINAEVKSSLALINNPSAEQIKVIQDKVGGIVIGWE